MQITKYNIKIVLIYTKYRIMPNMFIIFELKITSLVSAKLNKHFSDQSLIFLNLVFFLSSKPNLSDIFEFIYFIPALILLITQKKIKKTILKPIQNQSLKNNNIFNHIFWLVLLHLSLQVFYIFNTCQRLFWLFLDFYNYNYVKAWQKKLLRDKI